MLMLNISTLLLAVITAFIVSYLSTPIVIKFANKFGLIDDPSQKKHPKVIHTYPVPRGGGIAIFVSILISCLIFIPVDKHIIFILIGALLVTLLGVLDDKFDLNPYVRFVAQLFIAGLPIISGIGISFITNPFNGIINLSQPQINFIVFGSRHSIWLLSDAFALIWIVFMMNILNIGAKGVDGQLPGVVFVAACVIAVLSLRYSADITQWPVIVLAIIVAGAYLGFLPWNFYPQKIMPSFGGSTLAGYFLAILSILSTAKVGTLMVVLAVPLVDTGYVIVRRILSGKSPFWGDAQHLHHRLLKIGLSKRQVAISYWAFSAILGLLALKLNATQKLYTIIGIVIIIGGTISWLTYKTKKI